MYYVDLCPINKKKWGSGYKQGKSYANYKDDCRYCNYNPEFGHRRSVPKKIFCAGHIKEFNHLLKELIKLLYPTCAHKQWRGLYGFRR
jgi:hypothetical protein